MRKCSSKWVALKDKIPEFKNLMPKEAFEIESALKEHLGEHS
jgi:hypothetical protein